MPRKKTSKKRSRKKKKRKGTALGGFLKGVNWTPVLKVLLYILLLSAVVWGVRYFFMNSEFFRIKKVSVTDDRGYTFEEGRDKLRRIFKGNNIFDVDLERVARIMRNSFSQIKRVEARRVLPDKLEIDIISRAPEAVIDTAGGVVIDSEAVVLAVGTGNDDLIDIKGMNFFLNVPSRGETVESVPLENALLLIEGLKKKMRRELEQVEYIDISDENNLVIGVFDARVKMGTSGFSSKIDTLRQMMNDPDIDMNDIRYIDLRFEDPVISLKQ